MGISLTDVLDGWSAALGILLAGAVLGWLAKSLIFHRLRKLARLTATRTDDVLLDSTRGFWLPAIVLASVLPAARFAPIPPDQRLVIERIAVAGFLLLATFAASRFVGAWLAREETPGRPSLVQKVSRAAVLVAGMLLVLDNAGIEIKTLLTALGVGSLAVALALQPTLSNLFAGIHLSVAKPIRVGDFVELEDGMQGYVEDIGWRATSLRQLANSLVIVPNARLSDMRIVNYALPAAPQSIIFPMGVAYGSDLRQVERVTVEVARSVQQDAPEADPEHEPFIRFTAFGDSAIQFNVILRARAFTDRWPLIHTFVVRLKERYDREGIEIPFPQRVVHMAERAAPGEG
jgi:small-conductance mechanosensitive channel